MKSWKDCFAARARSKGLFNASDIAAALCAAQQRPGADAFEVTRRSVSNWLSGNNRPSRANLRWLNQILELDRSDPEWETWVAAWNASPSVQEPVRPNRAVFKVSHVLVGVTLFLGTATALTLGLPERDLPHVPYRPTVVTEVGQSLVIHGARAHCGETTTPAVTEIEARLPVLATGSLSVGQIGMRASRRCEGLVAAREIIYSAERIGVDHFRLFGDRMSFFVLARTGR